MKKICHIGIFNKNIVSAFCIIFLSFLLGKVSSQYVFAQYDANYKPTGEESVELCSQLEGSNLAQPGTGSDVRTYRKYDYTGLPEMRGDAGIDQNKQVKGAWCGQVKSDPIKLSEEAQYHLRPKKFCSWRTWTREINMNYSSPPDVNYRIPFAEEMARQWGGIWDAEHETEQTIDNKERIRTGGTPAQPLTKAEEAIRGQIVTEINNKTGVLKDLLSTEEQDELKCKFIDYVKQKADKSMYATYSVNGTRFTDIPCPPRGTDGKFDYQSAAYVPWANQWGKTWSKLGLFPNERTTGELKFDVCEDDRYFLWYGYPEVMKMTLSANELFKTLQPKEIQDKFYVDKFANLRDPLVSPELIGDAAGGSSIGQDLTGQQVAGVESSEPLVFVPPQRVVSVSSSFLNSFITVAFDSFRYFTRGLRSIPLAIGNSLQNIPPHASTVFAQSLEKVVPNNPVSKKLLAQKTSPGGTCQSSTLADGTINNPCAPDLAGPPPPSKPAKEEEDVPMCKFYNGRCQLGCEICKRAQVSPSDTELSTYRFNHIILGGDQSSPVQWTFHPVEEPYFNKGNCDKNQGYIECALDGYYSPCFPQCLKTFGYYDIKRRAQHDRIVDVYNNVPFLEAAWKLVAGTTPTVESGFLHAFTVNQIKGTGQINPLGCSSDDTVVFDSNGNFVPNPAASEIYWGRVRAAGELEGPGGKPFNDSNDKRAHAPDTQTISSEGGGVYMDVPAAPGKAKILFYRLGGLCNANKWVSGKELMPKSLRGLLASNPVTNPTPTPTPPVTSVGTQSNTTDSQTIGQKLSGIDATLPTNEIPTVTTVTNPSALSSQPVFANVQANDQIAVYSGANKVVVYRPQTNTIVTQAALIKIALRNGTAQNDLFQAFAQDLVEHSPNIVITEKTSAAKTDYGKTVLIDPTGTKKTDAANLALTLGLGLSDLPAGEPTSTSDFIIIYGGPQVVLRNGTSPVATLDAYEKTLKQAIPTVTITNKSYAATLSFTQSFVADSTDKKRAETQALAQKLGLTWLQSLGDEPKPANGEFVIILGSDKQ